MIQKVNIRPKLQLASEFLESERPRKQSSDVHQTAQYFVPMHVPQCREVSDGSLCHNTLMGTNPGRLTEALVEGALKPEDFHSEQEPDAMDAPVETQGDDVSRLLATAEESAVSNGLGARGNEHPIIKLLVQDFDAVEIHGSVKRSLQLFTEEDPRDSEAIPD